MTEKSPPSFFIAEVVYNRLKDELPRLVEEALKSKYSGWTEGGEAFDRGRLMGQTEARTARDEMSVPFESFEDLRKRFLDSEATIRDFRSTIVRLNAKVQTANEAYLNVATERDGVRGERNKAEVTAAREAAAARSLRRRLELVRAYLPTMGPGSQTVRDALDDACDPWSILLPNEPF